MSDRNYADPRLNLKTGESLSPVIENGVLAGIQAGRCLIPRPVAGVEHEHNIALNLPRDERRRPDAVGIDALLAATRQLGGFPARGKLSASKNTLCDRDRLIFPVGDALIHVYSDLDKFEISHGEFTSARGLMAFEEKMIPTLREIIARAEAILAEDHEPSQMLVHLSGGDGDSTCAALHLNIPWNASVSHACYVSMEAYSFLQETLLRQLAVITTLAATGIPGREHLLANSRGHSFREMIGVSTLEPNRAMQFNLLRGRPGEGYDRKDVARNMQMLATWPQSQVGRLLMVVLSQLETLRLHFSVVGLWPMRRLVVDHQNLVRTAIDFTVNPKLAHHVTRQALDEWHEFTLWLESQLGVEVTEQLVPDHRGAIAVADQCLKAYVDEDQETLIRMTDYAKKEHLIERYLSAQTGGWSEHRTALLNICFAFASPQSLSPYFTYFRPQQMELIVLSDRDVANAGPDPNTRAWFFGQIATRFAGDPLLKYVHFDWDRCTLRQAVTLSGGWVPKIQILEKAISAAASIGHNRATLGDVLDEVSSLAELFEVFANTENGRFPSQEI
jgi:hypothetical protein